MQTSVTQYNAQMLPGELGSDRQHAVIDTVIAAEVIPFGAAVEIVPGTNTVVLPKSTTLGTLAGIALRQVGRMGGSYAPGGSAAYQIGEEVPVLRRGRAYALYNGGTQALYGALNVKHSSTTATFRGYFTATATSSATGAEIDAAAATCCTPSGDAGVALVSINLG